MMRIFKGRWFLIWLIALLVIGVAAFLIKSAAMLAAVFAAVVVLIFLRYLAEREK